MKDPEIALSATPSKPAIGVFAVAIFAKLVARLSTPILLKLLKLLAKLVGVKPRIPRDF